MIYDESQILPLPMLVAAIIFIAAVFIVPLAFAWHTIRFSSELFFVVMAPFLVALLLTSIRLKTRLDDSVIVARIWPFPAVRLKYSEIREVEEVEYAPIADFGGWGIRNGLGGKIYSMRGSKAVKLSLVSGEIIYLGTQQPGKLSREISVRVGAK